MKVFLTRRAEKNFQSIKEYIFGKFGEKVAEAYEQKTLDFLNVLENFPEIGSIDVPEKEIRGFQLTKHTRVLYRIIQDRIIIFSFFDVRQHPEKKSKN